MSKSHALRRTSPKGPGQAFVGTCMNCGLTDLPLSRMQEPCVNPGNFTQDETLIRAILKEPDLK
jgi:hypothetical protein